VRAFAARWDCSGAEVIRIALERLREAGDAIRFEDEPDEFEDEVLTDEQFEALERALEEWARQHPQPFGLSEAVFQDREGAMAAAVTIVTSPRPHQYIAAARRSSLAKASGAWLNAARVCSCTTTVGDAVAVPVQPLILRGKSARQETPGMIRSQRQRREPVMTPSSVLNCRPLVESLARDLGLSIETIASALTVDRRTAERWRANQSVPQGNTSPRQD
jgi:hypothetical protein